MKSSYEKDLKSVNTRSILILIEPASLQEVLNAIFIFKKCDFVIRKRKS